MSCLTHLAGVTAGQEGSSQDDNDDHVRHRTGCGVRRSGLPCGHDSRRCHHRPGRPRRRRRVPDHGGRLRCGNRVPERPRHSDRRRGRGNLLLRPRVHPCRPPRGPHRDRGQPAGQGRTAPDRQSDPIDAYSAARAALSGRASVIPKDDTVSGIRTLHNAARSAVKARTATLNQIVHILITAPDDIRVKYTALRGKTQVDAISRLRPTGDGPRVALLTALKTLARRVQALTTEHDALTAALDTAATEHNPGLRAAFGVGPDTAAQLLVTAGGNPDRLRTEASFAALCGVAPVPASSGRTNRHRLSRGGDRRANAALYRIALVRMSSDARTREYVARQTAAGRTKKEIIRLLKGAIAREIFRYLTTPVTVPDVSDLRPARQAKNITLTTVAEHFGVWPAVISCIERGTRRDDDLASAYRDWLTTA